MTRTCTFRFATRSGTAGWSFDGVSLVVTPEDGSPIVVPVKEVAGVSGDGYTMNLGLQGTAGDVLELSMLGHDGPTLLDSFRREWLVARADVLRLSGSGKAWPVSGHVTGLDGATDSGTARDATVPPEPFSALLFEDVLVVAREGRDLEPLFLALFDTLRFDEATYTVHVGEWPGRSIVFSRLAKQTDEFVRRLRDSREVLAREAAAVLAAAVPGIPAGSRSVLAGAWMPGRLLELARMNASCPGFEAAFRSEWLPRLLRQAEAAHLATWATPNATWLGCARESGAIGDAEAAAEHPLWMLAGKNGVWFLEALSIEDRATYCFSGGDEMPALVSRLLCAPQFSKEALYNPLESLTGDSSDLAIPARYLGFLVELRARFRDRVIHQSLDGWRREVEKLGQGSG